MDFGKPILLIMCFVWIRVIYFYFVFVEDQSFKAHVQSVWNSHIPATSRKLLCNPSLFLDHGLLLYFDQTRSSANSNDKVGPLFMFILFVVLSVYINTKNNKTIFWLQLFSIASRVQNTNVLSIKSKKGKDAVSVPFLYMFREVIHVSTDSALESLNFWQNQYFLIAKYLINGLTIYKLLENYLCRVKNL